MTEPSDTVLRLWRAVASGNWEAVKAVVSDDCIFMDMPLGPTIAARGILSDIAQHCGITNVSADQVIPAATYFACH